MNTTSRRQALAALATLPFASAVPTAWAQSAGASAWAGKTIRIVVPYPPGGSSDVIGRLIAQPLGEALKATVVIDNKAGANGNLGADFVAKAAPDGLTLLLCDVGALAISPSVYTQLAFDPSRDLRGVTMLAYSPHMLVVHPSVPVNTLAELVALSRQKPLNFAVTAIGSAPHLAGVAVEQATKAQWQYIPYKGGAQAIQDTIGGTAQVLMNGMLATLPHVQSGKLKAIALSKKTRMALAPTLPTIAEQGVPGFESGTWQGLLAPGGTPPALVQQLNTALVSVIRSPEIRAKLVAQGAEVVTQSPAEFATFFTSERKRWSTVVSTAGIKAS